MPASPGPVLGAPISSRTRREPSAHAPGRPESGRAPGVAHRVGVSAAELLERVGHVASLDACELERWLLAEQLAVPNGAPGLLVPTELALELAEALRP
jgi:hypothetical protein